MSSGSVQDILDGGRGVKGQKRFCIFLFFAGGKAV